MRYKIYIPVFLAGLLVFALTVNARPENAAGKRNPRMGMMGHVFDKAGCPLTDAQKDQIKNLERGPAAREQFMSILTDDQKTALQEAQANRGDRGGRGHGGMMGHVLDKAGCPLTDAQKDQIKNLERGPAAREQFMSILTDEQKTALEETQANRGDRGGRGHGGMMGHVFDKAGCPLTDAQKDQIKNLERGPAAREQFMSILTGEQKTALENARKYTHKGNRRGPGIGKILEGAGYPLSVAQVEQLKNIARGSDRKEQIALILTDEQKAVLESHFTDRDSEENALQKPVEQEKQPETFNVLKQNYPNPFNPSTTIDYQLAKAGNVTVEVYGPNGQLVSTLANDFQNAGWHSVTWDASAHAGGIYVCRITSGDYTESRKMSYVK